MRFRLVYCDIWRGAKGDAIWEGKLRVMPFGRGAKGDAIWEGDKGDAIWEGFASNDVWELRRHDRVAQFHIAAVEQED